MDSNTAICRNWTHVAQIVSSKNVCCYYSHSCWSNSFRCYRCIHCCYHVEELKEAKKIQLNKPQKMNIPNRLNIHQLGGQSLIKHEHKKYQYKKETVSRIFLDLC